MGGDAFGYGFLDSIRFFLADSEDEALAIARRQQARFLELRAARSLSALWAAAGRRADARALLDGIYRWFTEGFDTPDLRSAQAELDQLT